MLHNVVVVTPGFEASTAPTYLLATNLDRSEVAQAFVAPETVSFWRLPGLAEETARAGLDPTAYLLKYQELLARPLMLASMVLVAACFSLRFFRMGGIEYMVSGGVAGGVRALCGDQSGQRSRRSRLPQRLRGGVVARGRRLHVWRVCAAATRGWLMGFAVSFSFESNPRQTRARTTHCRSRSRRCGVDPLARQAPRRRNRLPWPPSRRKPSRRTSWSSTRTSSSTTRTRTRSTAVRLGSALLPGPRASGRPRNLRPRHQARLRGRPRQDDG